MDPIVGSGRHTYHVNENWASVPDGIEFKPAAVAVDSKDRVCCRLLENRDVVPISAWHRTSRAATVL